MSRGIELIALIDLIYEAALDNVLWPGLIKLADAMGAAQVAMPSMDWRANVVRSRRASIPICLHLGRNIGRSMIRLCPRAALRPAGEVYTLASRPRKMHFQIKGGSLATLCIDVDGERADTRSAKKKDNKRLSQARSSRMLWPAPTRMALIASPLVPARRFRSRRPSLLA